MHYYTFIGAAKNKYKDIVAKKEREEKERLAKEKREQEKQNAENGEFRFGIKNLEVQIFLSNNLMWN